MNATPRPSPAWVKWLCLSLGLVLLLASLVGFAYTGRSGWTLWQQTHAHPKPANPKAVAPHLSVDAITPLAAWFMGELIALFLGVRLLQIPGKRQTTSIATAALQAGHPVPDPAPTITAKPVRRPAAKRWQSCNVLQIGADSRRLWSFGVGKSGFNLSQEHIVASAQFSAGAQSGAGGRVGGGRALGADAQSLPLKVVGRDWKTLFQPKLNIAWLPVEQVFLRVTQLPVSEFAETVAMVELQLEKLSPLPVTQIVWSVQVLPHQKDNLQTIIVIIMARELVEKFLGELEGQGFLADRLELPILDQLQATPIVDDGAYIYPDSATGKFTALVAWWYGGILRNLGLLHVPAGEGRDAILKEQLTQMAWAGEVEGWLHNAPRWHLVTDEATAANWQPMFRPWLGQSVELLAPLSETQLAMLNANRAAHADPNTGIMPAEYAMRYAQEFHDRLWMRGLVVVLAVYCAGAMIYLAGASVQGFRADTLETERAGLSRQYTNTLQLKAQLEILQNRQALKFASLDCWKTTAELIPENITVQTLDFKDGRHFGLSGVAGSEQGGALTDFNEALRKAPLGNGQPLFEKLDIPVVKLNPGGGTLSWSFGGDLAHVEEQK